MTATEELGIRVRADGVVELTNGLTMGAQATTQMGNAADKASPRIDGLGRSAKETRAALRMLPAQISDIIVGLTSGQPVYMVAIQQGAQIRDSFGGITPALKAVYQALGPVRLGMMGVAGAGALVTTAYVQGQREGQAYAQALLMTNNAAGTTRNELASMAQQVSATAGTQGKAAEVLAALAGTGEVGARQMTQAAQSIVLAERELGQENDALVKNFADLGRAPLEATLRLNRGLNYLTAATYDQIRALMAQGREAEAAALAQNTYAEAMTQRARQVGASVDGLTQTWRSFTSGAKRGWDEFVGLFRDTTPEQRIREINAELEAAAKRRNGQGPSGGVQFSGVFMEAQLREEQKLREERERLQRQLDADGRRAAENEAKVEEQKRQLRERELAFIEASNAKELASVRAVLTEREALEALALARSQAAASLREQQLRSQTATLDSLRERQALGDADFFQRRAALEQQALRNQMAVLDQQLAAEQRLAQARARVAAAEVAAEQRRAPQNEEQRLQQEARLAQMAAERAAAEAQSQAKVVDLQGQRAVLSRQLSQTEVDAARDTERANDAATSAWLADLEQRRQALGQYSEQLRQSNAATAVSLIADPYQQAVAQAQLSIQELERSTAQQLAALKSRLAIAEVLSPDSAQQLRGQIETVEQQKADAIVLINRELTERLKPEWQRMLEGWQDNTRLMRESFNEFQTGWLQEGERTWSEYARTGKLSLSSLKDFALTELGQLQFRQFIAPAFSDLGGKLAGLLGIETGSTDASGAAGVAAESVARTQNTSALVLGTTALGNLANMAQSAAAALASLGASGDGGGGAGGLLSLVGAIFGGGMTVDAGGAGITSGNTGLADLGLGAGRAFGGPVQAGGLHPINELGMPEVLRVGGKSFLMMGAEGGQVVPLRASGAAASGGGGSSFTYSPQVQIDARSDQAQVMQLVDQSLRAGFVEFQERMERRT